MKRKNLRSQWIIDPPFQRKILLIFLVTTFVVILLFFAAQWALFASFFSQGREMGLPPEHIYFRFLEEQKERMILYYAVTSFFIFIGMSVFGILFSHQIAGPIFRAKQFLKDLREKPIQEISPTNFRKNDEFQSLLYEMNETIKTLQKK